jgi:hypothetical protein
MPDHFEPVFASMREDSTRALLILADPLFALRRVQLAQLAARDQLLTACGSRDFSEAGCLISYRERQWRWYARQHHPSPSRRAKRVLVTVCEKLEAYLYAVQAVDKPSGNDPKHIGEGIERLLKVSMKSS